MMIVLFVHTIDFDLLFCGAPLTVVVPISNTHQLHSVSFYHFFLLFWGTVTSLLK
jgi:hypothetical protein